MRSLIDIGYAWPWTHGHLVVAALPPRLGGVAGWRPRPWLHEVFFVLVAAWAVAGFLVVQFMFRMNDVPRLPTQAFLRGGAATVLDLGAGSGRSSLMVLLQRPNVRLVALDNFSAKYINGNSAAKTMANFRAAGVDGRASVQAGDMRALPFPDRSFDAIVSAYAIDHLDRQGIEKTLREAARVVRPDGQFLLQVMYPDGWMRFAYGPLILHGARGAQLRERWRTFLERAGFTVVEQGVSPFSLYLLAVRR